MECFTYDKKALCTRYGKERRTIARTIRAAGLDPKRRLFSEYEVTTFIDPARTLLDKRFAVQRVIDIVTHPDFVTSGGIQTVLFPAKTDNSYSRSQLADMFQISLDTVKRSLVVAGFSERRDDFTSHEVVRFSTVRALFGEGKTAREIRAYLHSSSSSGSGSGSSHEDDDQQQQHKKKKTTFTKREIAALYGLSYDTVKRTIAACLLDTRRTLYTETELRHCFERARTLFENNFSSKEVSDYFRLTQVENIATPRSHNHLQS